MTAREEKVVPRVTGGTESGRTEPGAGWPADGTRWVEGVNAGA
jgi:hypothetical protein